MNLISLLGLLSLLAIAWALSAHRREVPLRTVVWGLGLRAEGGAVRPVENRVEQDMFESLPTAERRG